MVWPSEVSSLGKIGLVVAQVEIRTEFPYIMHYRRSVHKVYLLPGRKQS